MVVPEVVLDKEAGNDPTEDNTCLTLVIRDITGKLNELCHVDFRDIKSSDLGDKLEIAVALARSRGEMFWACLLDRRDDEQQQPQHQ